MKLATSLNILFIYSSCLPKLPIALNMETALTNKFDSFTDHVNDQLKKAAEAQSVELTEYHSALSDLVKKVEALADQCYIDSKISSLEKCFIKIHNTGKNLDGILN